MPLPRSIPQLSTQLIAELEKITEQAVVKSPADLAPEHRDRLLMQAGKRELVDWLIALQAASAQED